MIRIDTAADPATHELASSIASRLVWMIHPLLRPGERDDALRSAYAIVREEIERRREQRR